MTNQPNSLEWRQRAHDIKNIVATISMVADELLEASASRPKTLGRRLERSCSRVLELCCSEDRMIEDDGQPSMLSRVVADVIELGEGIAHPGIDLRFQSPEIVFCEGTASAVFRILANLLTNAIVAIGSNPGGVRIAARVSERGWINIVVADTGPGLGSSTASCSSGALPVSMGLGLTIAQSLTSRIGGTLKLEETGPAGTIFVLSFPIP